MFRFTIREVMLLTVMAGMGVAWGMEHNAHATLREDATFMARYGSPFRGACGNMVGSWYGVADKYWERPATQQEFRIVEENDGTMGLDFEP